MRRYYITLGAPTTANGKVISANHVDTIDGVPVALEGDRCWCDTCNSEGTIALDGARLSEKFDGREVALSDDLCLCKCSPPPRLVAAQTFACQFIDGTAYTAQADAALQSLAQHGTAGERAAAVNGIPFVLLDPKTQEPYRLRPYTLQLGTGTIEGTTDQNGATRPLSAAERAAVLAWHVDGGSTTA